MRFFLLVNINNFNSLVVFSYLAILIIKIDDIKLVYTRDTIYIVLFYLEDNLSLLLIALFKA